MKPNYGTLIDPDKLYPVTYTITHDGKKIFKKGRLKGCDLTENQVKELINNPKARIIISHGGKRQGSGRPKKKKSEKMEPTKVMRIPISKVTAVLKVLVRLRMWAGMRGLAKCLAYWPQCTKHGIMVS